MLKTASATIALLALANPVLAAGCASPSEAAALKTAVIQQELMVAALQCHEAAAYNRFVLNYRGELQDSDATLKTFFIRRGGEQGEAGYDSFKTKAANLSALEQARNGAAFCADAHALFTAALNHRGSLMSFVETRAGETDIGGICAESRPMLTRSEPKAPAGPPPVRVASTAQASDIAVGGVPTHSLPAIPYRHQDMNPPPQTREDMAREDVTREDMARDTRDDDEDDAAPAYTSDEDLPPPPRPRYYDQRGYYPPRSYGPPPGWRQRQAWREYSPPPSYGWYQRGW